MKSKLSFGYYIVIILITIFLWSILIGMSLDGTLLLFSKKWYLFILPIILTNLLFLISFLKIPKIQIIGNRFHFKSVDFNGEFEQNDITKVERVSTRINGWYTFRGGLKISAKGKIYDFPFHIYTNEADLLQKIHKVSDEEIPMSRKYAIQHLKYLKYFYRNFGTIYLLLSIPFLYMFFSVKKDSPMFSKLILAFIPFMFMLVFKLSSKYVRLDGCTLNLIDPLLLKSTEIQLSDIEYLSAKKISTGRGSFKNITIEFKNKSILTWRAELNKQGDLEEIVKEFNRKMDLEIE